MTPDSWKLFTNSNTPKEINWQTELPDPPSWRSFSINAEERKRRFLAPPGAIEVVNAALYLRRPLLVTGRPGTGKSSLAYAVAYELGLGEVLKWPITTRTTLQDGLYRYDAIARLRESERTKKNAAPEDIGKFIQLGPLGTALIPTATPKKPRILLIDEIDKSDIDLPNDLLNVFEDGEFDIPELVRIKDQEATKTVDVATYYRHEAEQRTYTVTAGKVLANTFPCVIMTSNGEREFPPAFLRRCLRLEMPNPGEAELKQIVRQHFEDERPELVQEISQLVTEFLKYQQQRDATLATDQLLNAVYLLAEQRISVTGTERKTLLDRLFQSLGSI